MVRSLLIDRAERLLGWVVAASLGAMMVLTFVDVVARKLLGAGVPGSVEITELLMLGVVFAGLPLASLKGEHIIFDMLDPLLPAWLLRWQGLLANATCAVLLTAAGVLVLQRAGRTAQQGDVTPALSIGLAKFHYLIGGLLLVTALVHLMLLRRGGADARADAQSSAEAEAAR
ncbi:MAG TPA: TRAP transporter small permease subunit [Burkholderiaceae bacterium]|nr:TRAP transporter small permease subunit [Burkholderiaceae bacterium]